MNRTAFRLPIALNVLFAFLYLQSAGQHVFQKVYHATVSEGAGGVGLSADGGYYLVGGTASYGFGGEMMVVKTDSLGNTTWSGIYGSSFNENATGVIEQDGYLYVAGTTDEFWPAAGFNGVLQRLDPANGNLHYMKLVSNQFSHALHDIQPSPDGSLIAFGWTIADFFDMCITKIDTSGDVIWGKHIGQSFDYEIGLKGAATSDGGAIIAGGNGGTRNDALIVKLDSLGGMGWNWYYGVDSMVVADDIIEVDSGYIVVGSTRIFGDEDIFLQHIDFAGAEQWVKVFRSPGRDRPNDIVRGHGGIAIAGFMTGTGFGFEDAMVMQTDAAGTPVWTRLFGGNDADIFSGLVLAPDGGYVAAGETHTWPPVQGAMYLVRMDSTGYSGCHEMSVFPQVVDTFFQRAAPPPMYVVDSIFDTPGVWFPAFPSFTTNTLCSGFYCNVNPALQLNDTVFCRGDSLQITDQTLGSTISEWTLGGALVSTQIADTLPLGMTGVQVLQLVTGSSFCTDTLDTLIAVHPVSDMTLNGDTLCRGDTLLLFNQTTGATASSWFIDGSLVNIQFNAQIPLDTVGAFLLTLESMPGDCPTDTVLTVREVPVADFSAVSTNLNAVFTDLSTNAVAWAWNFGDGGTSTVANPPHVYAQPGNYTVCLTVTNADGCTDINCQVLSVLVGKDRPTQDRLDIVPHPVGDMLQLHFGQPVTLETQYRITDLRGNTVRAGMFLPGHTRFQIDVNQLPAGMYLLEMENESLRETVRFIRSGKN